MPAGTARVIAVPWSHNQSCKPIPFERSVRWIADGTRGLFTAQLRPKAHWVSGVRTLDVFVPSWEPHTQEGAWVLWGSSSSTSDVALTPEQLMEVSDRLPTSAAMERDAVAALIPLTDWAREHPSLTRRYPFRAFARTLGAVRWSQAVRRVNHPLVQSCARRATEGLERGDQRRGAIPLQWGRALARIARRQAADARMPGARAAAPTRRPLLRCRPVSSGAPTPSRQPHAAVPFALHTLPGWRNR